MEQKHINYRIDESLDRRIKIDNRDEKILSILSDDSRTPISVIAKKIRLSKEAAFYRINKLKKHKVIIEFYPTFDLRDFGYYTYHVFRVINEDKPGRKDDLLKYLREHPNTKGIMEYSDRWDIEWIMVARNVQEFDSILTSLTRDFTDVIIEKHKFEIIFGYKSIQFPDPFNQGRVMLSPKKMEKKKIDETSIKIINQLIQDARSSTYKIAEKIGLSPDTVGYRIKKMKKEELIREFSIMPNLSLLGYHWHTMCIDVKTLDLKHELKFKEFISDKPHIIRAVKILGDWDLMLHIVTKKMSEMHRIVKDIQKNFVDIIVNYQTWAGYKEHFFTSLPRVIIKGEKKRYKR